MPKGVKGFVKGDPNIDKRGRIGPNKFTTLKQSFLDAYEAIGGTQALIDWMTKDTTLSYINKKTGKKVTIDISADRKKEFFKMMASMLPKEVQVSEVPLDKASLIEAIQGMNPNEIKDLIKTIS